MKRMTSFEFYVGDRVYPKNNPDRELIVIKVLNDTAPPMLRLCDPRDEKMYCAITQECRLVID